MTEPAPGFGDVATLRYGLAYERNFVDWYEWQADRLG